MGLITLTTIINKDVVACFDLARDIDFHQHSMVKTNERAVAGRVSGLCDVGDTITWEAVHFGLRQRLSVEITKMERPHFFEDRMTKGAFKRMRHEHHFKEENGKTTMTDKFEYEVPFGFVGRLFDRLVLRRYMTQLLVTRNNGLKSAAEKSDI